MPDQFYDGPPQSSYGSGAHYPDHDYGGYPPPPSQPVAYAPPPPPGRPARTPVRILAATAVTASVIGAAAGAITVAATDHSTTGGSAGLTFSTQAAPAVKVDGSVSSAAATIEPSVVTIKVSSGQEQDTGSGVIIRQDGYVLTNNHVISNASGGSLTVTLKDGRQVPGKVVGADASDDLAVVKIALSGLQPARFASSASLVVGQTVVAVGAPLGLSDTVTAGIVSNTARPVQTGDGTTPGAVFNAVQTDAAINPGNSGGPLVNLAGAVVGINAAIATDPSQGGLQIPGQASSGGNIGIGFAIPSDEASRIAGQLMTTGKATHAIMGITVGDSTSSSTGAVVKSVTPNGPAASAGIKAGDVVTKLDTQLIADANALVAAVRSHAPGDTVVATVLRGGKSHAVTVKLGAAAS